jgi:hypothetical protein
MGHSSERVEYGVRVCPRREEIVALTIALGSRRMHALATAGLIVVQSRRPQTQARAPVFSTAPAQVELLVDHSLAEDPVDGQA